MSVPVTIIAAGSYSNAFTEERTYPWFGMVVTGFGNVSLNASSASHANWTTNVWDPADLPLGHDLAVHCGPFLKEGKIALMMGRPGCCEDTLREICWKGNTPFLLNEVIDMTGMWIEKKEEFMAKVKIPVLYALGTQEWLWKPTRETIESFTRSFTNAPRAEGAVVEGAPHLIEWSQAGAGWWLRVFGCKAEVTASTGIARLDLEPFK